MRPDQDQLDGLKHAGRVVANAMHAIAKAMEPGMTTRELDGIGRALIERDGATPAPEAVYAHPGATCISVNEEFAHGVSGDRVILVGDLGNIDVSASKDGYFADTGATFRVGPVRPSLDRLCQDGNTRGDGRRMHKGVVLTVEPFLSTAATWAREGVDDWTLYSEPRAPVVQYEHTVVATDGGRVIVTLPG